MTETQYDKMQEDEAYGKSMVNLIKEFLEINDVANLGEFNRDIYKCTDCGLWISYRLHDGSWCHSGDSRVYDPSFINAVDAILIGSIVEGSDAEVTGDLIELKNYMEEDGVILLNRDVKNQIVYVDNEASMLWEEANNNEDDEYEDEESTFED